MAENVVRVDATDPHHEVWWVPAQVVEGANGTEARVEAARVFWEDCGAGWHQHSHDLEAAYLLEQAAVDAAPTTSAKAAKAAVEKVAKADEKSAEAES